MDFTTLTPALVPAGAKLTGDELTKAVALLDDDEQWDELGVEEIEAVEAAGVATAAFRTPAGLRVGVREFTHTPEQLEQAAALRVKWWEESGVELSMPVASIVGPGEDVRTVAVYGGYETEEAAVADARRLLLGSVIEQDAFSQAAGWNAETVVLARGADRFVVFRTYPGGRIEVGFAEDALNAYELYATTVTALAAELTSYERAQELPPATGKIISAWLLRESAHALAEQARVSLSGALSVFSYQPSLSTAELARSLHTDRGNLSRLISKAAVKKP